MYRKQQHIFIRLCVVPYIYRSNTTFSSGETLEFMDSESPVVGTAIGVGKYFFPCAPVEMCTSE